MLCKRFEELDVATILTLLQCKGEILNAFCPLMCVYIPMYMLMKVFV
jgi:hypothetical protein